MARLKISEYKAKKLLLPDYLGLSASSDTTSNDILKVFGDTNLVVKVDQGIKKRGLQGLVKVNVTSKEIPAIIETWSKLGWSNFLIEPVIEHSPNIEHYMALERVRDGWQISYSASGGVEVESSWDQVKIFIYPGSNLPKEIEQFTLSLIPLFNRNHISFLEMNPILVRGDKLVPLDMACEVDSAGYSGEVIEDKALRESEGLVAQLDASTPASLKFKILSSEGNIWVFLSGGGASLVIADEVADQGMGAELANYGEYSGAPSDDDVYSYAKIILAQLLSSKNIKKTPKAIIIAGGVANFTDVVKTFSGLIRALDEKSKELVQAKVKVFVRRGGPNESNGLQMMSSFLTKADLFGSVHGHDVPLTQVVSEVKEYLK